MAEGDLITADWQVEIRGKLFGPTTNWRVAGLDRFRSRRVKTNDTSNDAAHGSTPGIDYVDADAKVLRLNAGKFSQAVLEAELEELDEAWQPGETVAVCYQLGGVKWRRHGRTRAIDPDLSQLAVGYLQVLCEFEDVEGLAYSAVLHTDTTGVPVLGAGITPPLTPPITLPSSSSTGALSVTNNGPADAPWTGRLTGPLTNPAITHQGQGLTLDFSANGGLVLAASDYLDIDSRAGTAMLNGVADRRNNLNLGSRFFDLDPGANTILFAADAGSGTFRIDWRDTWYS